jgi:hypothetical protein
MIKRIFIAFLFLVAVQHLRAQLFERDPRFGVKAAYGYYDKWNYAGIALLYDNLLHIPDTSTHHLIIASRVICAGMEMRIGGPKQIIVPYVGVEGHLAAFVAEARAMAFTDFSQVEYCVDLGLGFSIAGWVYITGGFLIPPAGVDPLGMKGTRIAAGVNIPLVKLKRIGKRN